MFKPEIQIEPPNLTVLGKNWLDKQLLKIEEKLQADVLCFIGPIEPGLDNRIKHEIEKLQFCNPQKSLVVIMETPGGSIQIVERLVTVFRTHYQDVSFLAPSHAMSAGTILAMSGDSIMMSYYSLLGPIDPQVLKDGKWVPALSYLKQYDRLIAKSAAGQLTKAELTMLMEMDLAELDSYDLARNLSEKLIVEWLSQYKFKDWEKGGKEVSIEIKRDRAKEIAEMLNDQKRWNSHGRGINMKTLENEMTLRIDDYRCDEELYLLISHYMGLVMDFMVKHYLPSLVLARSSKVE